jgi:hypothetical protein
MYSVCVVRQRTVIAVYGPFADRDTANEFAQLYLDHEADISIAPNYGTITA